MSSVLVWVRQNDPHTDPALASWVRHQPGEVIATHPDNDHNWGADIDRLGWWRVLRVDAPVEALHHLLEADEPSMHSHVGIRRLRKLRLDLEAMPYLPAYSLADLQDATREVAQPDDYNLIG